MRVNTTVNTRLIACLLAGHLFAVLPLAAQSLPDVFAKMDKSAKGFSTLAADIKQTAHTAIVNDDSTQTGTIKLKRTKSETNFLVNFTAPDAKTVSIDGGEVSVYIPKAKSAQIYDLRSKRTALEQGMLLGFGATSADLKAAYDVTYLGQETIAGQPTGHIKLIPKAKEVQQSLKSAELWISDAQGVPLRQKFLTTSGGDYTLMEYANIRINPGIPDRELKLSLPKGTQIQKVGK